jgi:DNA modification methylase
MKKHKFNIFPEMQSEDYKRLLNDIQTNGYDIKNPIYLYEEAILDGWNRHNACKELNINPVYKDFIGDDVSAINFVLRSNKRRNLTSSQWACIASEADDIIKAISEQVEKERREKLSKHQTDNNSNSKQTVQLIVPSETKKDNSKLTDTKIAETFNTNRTYISEATKLKETNPEVFEQVKAGAKTFTEIKKEEKQQKLEVAKEQNKKTLKAEVSENKPTIYLKDCVDFLNTLENNSQELLITDPPYSTDIKDIKAFTERWLLLALNKVKETGRIFICTGAYPLEIKVYLDILLNQNKFIVDNPLIWTYKNTLGVTPKMKYNLNYQIIYHLYSEKSTPLNIDITNEMFNVQEINAPDGRLGNRFHTWQKPDQLAMQLIKHTTKENDSIFDCFACTGTFLLMASKMNRKAIGSDNSKENLKIAEERGASIIY